MSSANPNPSKNGSSSATNPSSSSKPSTSSSSALRTTPIRKSCAACKSQRRGCRPNCELAPYFPADKQLDFDNAYSLFGVSNIRKIIRPLDAISRDDAMRSIIYEANARAADPVGGCHRIIHELYQRIHLSLVELAAVDKNLAMCRAEAVFAAVPQEALPPDLSMHTNMFLNSDALMHGGANYVSRNFKSHQQHQHHQQQILQEVQQQYGFLNSAADVGDGSIIEGDNYVHNFESHQQHQHHQQQIQQEVHQQYGFLNSAAEVGDGSIIEGDNYVHNFESHQHHQQQIQQEVQQQYGFLNSAKDVGDGSIFEGDNYVHNFESYQQHQHYQQQIQQEEHHDSLNFKSHQQHQYHQQLIQQEIQQQQSQYSDLLSSTANVSDGSMDRGANYVSNFESHQQEAQQEQHYDSFNNYGGNAENLRNEDNNNNESSTADARSAEQQPMENVEKHDLKSAASLFTLRNQL